MSAFYESSQSDQVDALRWLAEDALAHYEGSFSSPELIKYRENAIFSVRRANGDRFVLRVHRPNYHSNAALKSELSWMRALAEHGLPVPGLLLNHEGEALTTASAPDVPEKRKVDLLTWIEGAPLSHAENNGGLSPARRLELYRLLGRLTAELHQHGSTWERPDDFRRHDWFADALLGEDPIWGRYWDLPQLTRAQRQLLISARTEGANALNLHPRHKDNTGLIHADLIADNLLVRGDVIHPIDFDDAGEGWHIFDIATTLYFLAGSTAFEMVRDAMIAGYREVRPLPEEEVQALPLFLMLRGTTYLGWVGSRSETATAREHAPELIERACTACEDFLASR